MRTRFGQKINIMDFTPQQVTENFLAKKMKFNKNILSHVHNKLAENNEQLLDEDTYQMADN